MAVQILGQPCRFQVSALRAWPGVSYADGLSDGDDFAGKGEAEPAIKREPAIKQEPAIKHELVIKQEPAIKQEAEAAAPHCQSCQASGGGSMQPRPVVLQARAVPAVASGLPHQEMARIRKLLEIEVPATALSVA